MRRAGLMTVGLIYCWWLLGEFDRIEAEMIACADAATQTALAARSLILIVPVIALAVYDWVKPLR